MKIKFTTNCLGYSVGANNTFEMEIDEWEIANMENDEKKEYIEKSIREYIAENTDFSYDIEE